MDSRKLNFANGMVGLTVSALDDQLALVKGEEQSRLLLGRQ